MVEASRKEGDEVVEVLGEALLTLGRTTHTLPEPNGIIFRTLHNPARVGALVSMASSVNSDSMSIALAISGLIDRELLDGSLVQARHDHAFPSTRGDAGPSVAAEVASEVVENREKTEGRCERALHDLAALG